MPNSIYNQLNGNNNGYNLQDPQNFMNSLRQFASTLQGDPQQMVMQLLQSGKISPQQLNYYKQIASQLLRNK